MRWKLTPLQLFVWFWSCRGKNKVHLLLSGKSCRIWIMLIHNRHVISNLPGFSVWKTNSASHKHPLNCTCAPPNLASPPGNSPCWFVLVWHLLCVLGFKLSFYTFITDAAYTLVRDLVNCFSDGETSLGCKEFKKIQEINNR